MQISIINNGKGQNRIHAAGCADVKKEERKSKNEAWTIEAASQDELALALWSDIAGDHHEPGTAEHLTEVRELLGVNDEFAPCVADKIAALPQTSVATKAIGVTRYSANGHYLKAVGTSVKTICGSTPNSVQREGEFKGAKMCSRCEKAVEQGQVPLTVEQFDWNGEAPRLIASTVEDSTTELATVKVEPKEEAPEAKPEAKPAKRKPAAAKKTTAKAAPKATGSKLSATATELLEFVVLGHERGVLTSAQKSSYRTVTRRLLEAKYGENWTDADVFETELEALDVAFRNYDKTKSETTYKVYKGDLRKALEFYTDYLADKAAWEKAHPAKAAK